MVEIIPAAIGYSIVGADVHGLCIAGHPARELKARNRGTGAGGGGVELRSRP
jgi:hypothetical protein